jgi:hypothetical protein
MTFTLHDSKIHTIKPGNRNFQIMSGLVVASRAAFEISENCPRRYGEAIETAINNGWLIPVANVTERELLFIGLNQRPNLLIDTCN